MSITYSPPKKPEPADRTQTSICGTVVSIRFRNAETGWGVFNARSEGQQICCVGSIVDDAPEGREYTFTGAWKNDPKFGWQFAFESYGIARPQDLEGLRRYLGGGIAKGIGEACASSIIEHFGMRTLEVLDSLDVMALQAVPGIGEAKAESIVEAWATAEKDRGLSVELLGKGISAGLCVKIIRYYEDKGIDPLVGLSTDPYQLTELFGVGFITADMVSRKFGIGLFDPRRLKAASVYALQQSRDGAGHVFLPHGELVAAVTKLCSVPIEKVEDFLAGRSLGEDLSGGLDEDEAGI